jgi:hypothetical protein
MAPKKTWEIDENLICSRRLRRPRRLNIEKASIRTTFSLGTNLSPEKSHQDITSIHGI